MFLSLPPGTKMFQFPGFAHLSVCRAFNPAGSPIRTPADQLVFANPRSFSQLTTSFFAYRSQGIPRSPFLSSSQNHSRPLAGTLCFLKLQSAILRNQKKLSFLNNKLSFAYSFYYLVISLYKSMNFLDVYYAVPGVISQGKQTTSKAKLRIQIHAPKRRCSSHTFRYGYLVTT